MCLLAIWEIFDDFCVQNFAIFTRLIIFTILLYVLYYFVIYSKYKFFVR